MELIDDPRIIAKASIPSSGGELIICDDGDEVTLFLGDITHCHFSRDYLGNGNYSPVEETCDEAIELLDDLFRGQVVFYRDRRNGSNGLRQTPTGDSVEELKSTADCYLWSERLD